MDIFKNKSFTKFLPVYFIILSLVILLSASYALLRSNNVGEHSYTMNVGLLQVDFYGTANTLSLNNAYPMTDEEGLAQNDILEFTIKNTGQLAANYSVYIEETSTSPELKNVIRYSSNKNNEVYQAPKTLGTNKYIDLGGVIGIGEEINYKVKVWLAESADSTYMNKTFSAKIVVESSQIQTGRVQNNKQYIMAKVKNYENESEKGESLATNDTMVLTVTGDNTSFTYEDSLNNVETTGSSSLSLTYNLSTKTDVDVKIYMVPTSGNDTNTDITIRLTKNGNLEYEYVKNIDLVGSNYCTRNGYTRLSDCILISENYSETVDEAKKYISDKGEANVNDTAPSTTDPFNSQVGLYKTIDNQGDTYFYRGNVTDNNVSFGGYYWKIIRINGDGSIRLIFNGPSADATGYNTNISNETVSGYGTSSSNYGYAFNQLDGGPTYVGYMYNESNNAWWTTTLVTYNNFDEEEEYYFTDDYEDYTDTYGNRMFKLKANTFLEKKKLKNLTEGELNKTLYTCSGTSSDLICTRLVKIASRTSNTAVSGYYLTYSPNTTDKNVVQENNKDSNAKRQLEAWYENKFMTKLNNGKQVSTYLVDNTFCNDRSITRTGSYNSGYLLTARTYFAARTRLLDAAVPNKSSTLICANANDMFSTTSTYGNTKLTYPIGLITADEVALAGGVYNQTNENYSLRTGATYWTMSPSDFYSSSAYTRGWSVYPTGYLYHRHFTIGYGLRAVINLKSDVLISSGDGSIANPYIID